MSDLRFIVLVSRFRNSLHRISKSKGHHLFESRVIQLPKFGTQNVPYFGIITLAMLLAFVVSPSAVATDVESLPAGANDSQKVAGQCLDALIAFDQELADAGFGVLAPGGSGMSVPSDYSLYGVQGTPRQKIRGLRDAAYIYATDGDEASCHRTATSFSPRPRNPPREAST